MADLTSTTDKKYPYLTQMNQNERRKQEKLIWIRNKAERKEEKKTEKQVTKKETSKNERWRERRKERNKESKQASMNE